MFPVSDVIPSKTTPYITIALIAANVLAFAYELRLSRIELQSLAESFGVVPVAFAWPTLLTSQFLHAGPVHLFGNMLYLWIFGDNVEDQLGHVRYLAFYLFCGAGAALGQVAVSPASVIPMIGASGAIAGVMGAYFVMYPRSRVLAVVFLVFFLDLIEIPAIFFLGIWFVMQLFSGVGSIGTRSLNGGVAFWAHIVGFGVGVAGGLYWRVRETMRRRARASR